MDVGAWLAQLGLQDFADAFRDNGVDVDLLPELTNEDLKDLGISRLADRKRLLKAITELADANKDPVASNDPEESSAQPAPPPTGERRQVTVMFADLAGFTSLSRELDAEEVHALLNGYFERADAIVEQYGGTIDKHIGDGLMAVFGAPVAHTDDPERAVRAALTIHDAMQDLSNEFGRDLRAHIGIASGQVVASGTGSDSHREYTVTGDSVNLASRLDDMAEAGETLITGAVRRATSHVAVASARGEVSVKGFDQQFEVWAVQDLSQSPAHARLTNFVGRNMECRQFEALLDETIQTGKGHTVVVRGEPGIGKTRLVEQFGEAAASKGLTVYKSLILDFGDGKAQDALRGLVRDMLGVGAQSGEAERRRAVQTACDAKMICDDRVIFLYDLMDLPQPAEWRSAFDAMDAEIRQQGFRDTLGQVIGSTASSAPMLIAVEDIHWADDSTLLQLAGISQTCLESPVLLVMTTRVEGATLGQDWLASLRGCPLATLELQPLRPAEAMTLANEMASQHPGLESLVDRAEGNPLFLEQLLQNAAEGSASNLPDNLQGLVLARIDRLNRADRDAIRAASALGQRFSSGILRHVLGDPAYDCRALLEHRLIRPEGSGFLFAHALVREGIYTSLLQDARRKLHGLAADYYRERDPVLHAEHLDRAQSPMAVQAYLDASRVQMDKSRYDSALGLVRRGLEIGGSQLAFELRLMEGDLLRHLGSIRQSIDACRAALPHADEPMEHCRAKIAMAEGLRIAGQHTRLLDILVDAEEYLSDEPAHGPRSRIEQLRGSAYFTQGKIMDCLAANTRALEHARHESAADLEAQALGGLGDAEFARGWMLTAHDYYDRCVQLSENSGFASVLAANLSMRGFTFLYQNRLAAAIADCRTAAELATHLQQRRARMVAAAVAAYVLEAYDTEEGASWAREIRDIGKELGSKTFEQTGLQFLSRFAMHKGEFEPAFELISHALDLLRDTESGMRFDGARNLGCLALATVNAQERDSALAEGEALLQAGATGHNYFWFYRDAMEVCLREGLWDKALHYARALEDYTAAQPLPWSNFHIRRCRALAAAGQGHRKPDLHLELQRLQSEAKDAGFRFAGIALERALAEIN